MEDRPPIWDAFCTALGAEYREHKELQGSSGLTHQLHAIGVDDKNKRLIIVSPEANPRITALMRIDLQATMPDVKVLVARPLAVDLAHAARSVFDTNTGQLDISKVTDIAGFFTSGENDAAGLQNRLGPSFPKIFSSLARSDLPVRSHLLNVVEQGTTIDWSAINQGGMGSTEQFLFEVLNRFRALDNLADDRKQGICPVPTYEFTDADWELFHSRGRIDEVRERLKALNIYQYFYPPADTLALGLIDKGAGTAVEVSTGLQRAALDGHILSPNDIVPEVASIPELIEEMREQGLVASGEVELEITPEGRKLRQKIQFRPREGLIERLSKIISLKIDLNLKDVFWP